MGRQRRPITTLFFCISKTVAMTEFSQGQMSWLLLPKQSRSSLLTLVNRVLPPASYYLLPDLPMKLSNHSLFLLTFAFHILTTKPGKALFLFVCKDFFISAGHAFLLASSFMEWVGGFATQITMKMEAIKAELFSKLPLGVSYDFYKLNIPGLIEKYWIPCPKRKRFSLTWPKSRKISWFANEKIVYRPHTSRPSLKSRWYGTFSMRNTGFGQLFSPFQAFLPCKVNFFFDKKLKSQLVNGPHNESVVPPTLKEIFL